MPQIAIFHIMGVSGVYPGVSKVYLGCMQVVSWIYLGCIHGCICVYPGCILVWPGVYPGVGANRVARS
jgi:hypothetical protein